MSTSRNRGRAIVLEGTEKETILLIGGDGMNYLTYNEYYYVQPPDITTSSLDLYMYTPLYPYKFKLNCVASHLCETFEQFICR